MLMQPTFPPLKFDPMFVEQGSHGRPLKSMEYLN